MGFTNGRHVGRGTGLHHTAKTSGQIASRHLEHFLYALPEVARHLASDPFEAIPAAFFHLDDQPLFQGLSYVAADH